MSKAKLTNPEKANAAKTLFSVREEPSIPVGAIDFGSLRFLVIDDSTTMREWLRNCVLNLGKGCSVDQSGAYFDALNRIKNKEYDIIICDYILADDRDGQQLLEECRRSRLIKSSVVWLMVTAESGYTQVVSAAELAPDDYILKPLKPDRLADRLFVCYAKKQRLKPVTDLLDAQDYEAAIAAAELLLKQDGQPLMLDLYRLIGEAAIASENYLRAYDAYQHILVDYPEIPWARLGAAKAYYHLERFDESQEILESLIKDNPDYLQSHDWLARIHALRGNEEDAKDLLKDILRKNPKALKRHREIIRMAQDTDDNKSALGAYDLMVKHGGGGTFVRPPDLCTYSKMLMDEKNTGRLEGLQQQTRNWYGKQEEYDYARSAVAMYNAKATGNTTLADQHYKQMKMKLPTGDDLTEEVKMVVLDAAVTAGDRETALNMAKDLSANYAQNEQVSQRITKTLTNAGMQKEAVQLSEQASQMMVKMNSTGVELARKGDMVGAAEEFIRLADSTRNLMVMLNAALAICRVAETQTLSMRLTAKLSMYLEYAQGRDPDNPKVIRLKELATPWLNKSSNASESL